MLQRPIAAPFNHNLLQMDASRNVRGEKEWGQWAQDLEDFSIKQTDVANKRLPYASTLQLSNLESVDSSRTVRGEKEWGQWAQDLEDFSIKQTEVANKRLPYYSNVQLEQKDETDVQLGGEKMSDDAKVPLDFHFVHLGFEDGELLKIEDNKGIPLDFRF